MTKEQILERVKIDLETRGRTDDTVQTYCMHVRLYQDHFNKPADEMSEDEISAYLHFLIKEKKLSPASVNAQNSSLRFLYGVTLDRLINTKKIPRIKHNRSIPILPTKDELGYLLYLASENPRNKALFYTIYGSGLRSGEASNLKVGDIDSENGRIFIRRGKGGRDRYVLLPKKTLEALREYWAEYQPKDWLFITKSGGKMTSDSIRSAWKTIVKRSGISKDITVHTLRHLFATHLLNQGNNVFAIKHLLGHVRIDTTTWYLQLADSDTLKVKSPLDKMKERSDA